MDTQKLFFHILIDNSSYFGSNIEIIMDEKIVHKYHQLTLPGAVS